MRQEDVPVVHAIDAMSFQLPWPERSYRFELVENPNSELWVAEVQRAEGAVVVGMIVLWVIIDEAHIGSLAVHPDYRRQGIAQALLVRSLQEAARRGATQATLEVRRSNLAAQALYHRFGFQVVGIRPRYYRDNHEDALLMTVANYDPAAL
jgi:ribosomal-protein-alanine N-acetyltransferase